MLKFDGHAILKSITKLHHKIQVTSVRYDPIFRRIDWLTVVTDHAGLKDIIQGDQIGMVTSDGSNDNCKGEWQVVRRRCQTSVRWKAERIYQ